MPPKSRRRFIRDTSVGVAAMATVPKLPVAGQTIATPATVPHRSQTVPGIHAYALKESVAAGEEIQFCVSADTPYQFSIARLGVDPDSPAKDEVIHDFDPVAPMVQPIHPGSCVVIEKAIKKAPREFTIECWLRPWAFGRWQDVMSQMNYPEQCDFALAISPEGRLTFYFGNGGVFNGDWALNAGSVQLQANQWHHVVLTRSSSLRQIWLDGRKVAEGETGPPGSELSWKAPLRLGAGGTEGETNDLFDGDIAMPVLYERALGETEIKRRFDDKGLRPPGSSGVLACWPLTEEKGASVADISPHQRHGHIVNHATWMIGGPSFDAEVPRFGNYDPANDPQRGHGLRFASDDLYDCGWKVTHRFRIPADARSGIYVGRLRFEQDGAEHLQHVTFIVRRPRSRRQAPILVLCATNTWRAYNGTPFGRTSPNLKQVFGTGGTENSPGDPPAYNFYRAHAAGQGTYQVGLRIPWPAAGPYIRYGGPTDYSHLMRADRFAQIWLEEAGYEFDVIGDLDLHRHPELLQDYSVFVINGHSEYWSIPMYEGLRSYLQQGGNAVVLSGNSLFWRVSFNEEETILECRKVDAPGNQMPPERRGECWHSQDGLRGSLTNECGMPGWKLIGLTTLGWNNQGNPKNFGPYVAEATDHFLFHEPEETGLKPGEKFGWAGEGQLPMANGHEFDVRPSTLDALQEKPSPEGMEVPDDPEGIQRLANGIIPWKEGGAAFDYWFNSISPGSDQGGEMIYWERPEGGRVFNAGAIGSGWALRVDPKFQALMRNVLHHFGVPGSQV